MGQAESVDTKAGDGEATEDQDCVDDQLDKASEGTVETVDTGNWVNLSTVV